jgi:hypothetical protein
MERIPLADNRSALSGDRTDTRRQRRASRNDPEAVRAEVEAARELTAAAATALRELVWLTERVRQVRIAAIEMNQPGDFARSHVADLVHQIRAIVTRATHNDISLLDGTLSGRCLDVGPLGEAITIDITPLTEIVAPLTTDVPVATAYAVVEQLRAQLAQVETVVSGLDDALVLMDLVEMNDLWVSAGRPPASA